MKMLLSLIALLSAALIANAAPPTCYSRVLSLSKEITESFKELQTSKAVDSCVEMLPSLYLDIHCSKAENIRQTERCLTHFVRGNYTIKSCKSGPCRKITLKKNLPGAHRIAYCTGTEEQCNYFNYCVLAKLRDFVAYPRCERVLEVSELKEKARSLYTIMISYCRRDLVFLTDDCSALENPILPPIEPSIIES